MEEITAIVCRLGKMPAIGLDEDFYEAGLSSVSALELLLELEAACNVTIPDEEFIDARTVRALQTVIQRLQEGQLV